MHVHRLCRIVLFCLLTVLTIPLPAATPSGPDAGVPSGPWEIWFDSTGSAPVDARIRDVDGAWRCEVTDRPPAAAMRRIPDRDAPWTVHEVHNDFGAAGDTPMEVVYTPDGGRILIANRDSRSLTVIDAETHAFLATIALSGAPNSVAIGPDGAIAVTANLLDGSVSLVDLDSLTETVVVPVADDPMFVRITADGVHAVVGCAQGPQLAVIHISSARVLRTISGVALHYTASFVPALYMYASWMRPFDLLPDSRTAVVAAGNAIQFVDLRAGRIETVACAPAASAQALTPDGKTLVVAHGGPDRVSVVDVDARTVTSTISIPSHIWYSIVVDPAGERAVVGLSNNALLVDLETGAVSDPLCPTGYVGGLVMTADGRHCLVGNLDGSLVDLETGQVVTGLNPSDYLIRGMAVSPTGPHAAMFDLYTAETLIIARTDGADAAVEAILPAGPPPEFDKAVRVAIGPDGSVGALANVMSDDVSLVNLASGEVNGRIAAGQRPSDLAFTPDGAKLIVSNTYSDFLTVIGVAHRTVANVPISTRATKVAVSPDSRWAYAAVITGGDGVWRVDLDALAAAGGKVPTGNLADFSAMELSHDGSVLVTCNTYDDDISLIDTAAWVEIARVPVGDSPHRAVFAADDRTLYVANRDEGTVSVVALAGAESAVVAVHALDYWVGDLALTGGGERLFVGCADVESAFLAAVDLPTGRIANWLELDAPVTSLQTDAGGELVYVATGWIGLDHTLHERGSFLAVDVASATVRYGQTLARTISAAAVDPTGRQALLTMPVRDEVSLIRFEIGDESAPLAAPVSPTGGGPRLSAWPTPFNPRTTIGFDLAAPARVTVVIHDLRGRKVRTLAEARRFDAGEHSLNWSGTNDTGRAVPAGVYVCRLGTDGGTWSTKLTLVR